MNIGLNCWEFRQCGCEPNGAQSARLGVCQAATEKFNHGVNQGTNSGRMCWAVVGTYNGGQPLCERARTLISCVACDFFQKVREEEGTKFKLKNWGMSLG